MQLTSHFSLEELTFSSTAQRLRLWGGLIDFENIADFASNLTESRVVTVSEDKFTIFQRGAAPYGLL